MVQRRLSIAFALLPALALADSQLLECARGWRGVLDRTATFLSEQRKNLFTERIEYVEEAARPTFTPLGERPHGYERDLTDLAASTDAFPGASRRPTLLEIPREKLSSAKSWAPDPHSPPLMIRAVSPDRTEFLTTDAFGRHHAWHVEWIDDGMGRTVPATEAARRRLISDAQVDVFRGQPEPARSPNALRPTAENLALNQLRASLTNAELTSGKAIALRRATQSANRAMLDVLNERRALTVNDLRNWNAHVAGDRAEAGVVRGTRVRGTRVRNPRRFPAVDIDLRHEEMVLSASNPNVPDIRLAAPDKVPRMLNELIDKINRVEAHTPLETIAALQQEFVVIHPFIDGNGRTVRVLLDYMLLRAGLPPMPHDIHVTRSALYRSPAETADIWRIRYSRLKRVSDVTSTSSPVAGKRK